MKPNEVYDLQLVLAQLSPADGSRWTHYKGGVYKVVKKGIESNDPHRVFVLYQSEDSSSVWVHSLDEWEKTVTQDGREVRRFTPYHDYMRIMEDQWD